MTPSVGESNSFQKSQSVLPPAIFFKQISEVLTLCKQMVIEAPVSGLELDRQDLGVRHSPKPKNKLPEAH